MLGLLGVAVSNVSFAEQLRCEQDFPKIKRMLLQEKNIYDRGSFDELLKYYQRTEYSELFTANHPGEKFLYDRWSSEEEYRSTMQEALNFFREQRFSIKLKISKPQQNFILDDQELCILQVTLLTNPVLEEPSTDDSAIMVRKLDSLDWHGFTVSKELNEQDFREFFPNFPKNIAIKELDYTH